jgi:hypothetical protein
MKPPSKYFSITSCPRLAKLTSVWPKTDNDLTINLFPLYLSLNILPSIFQNNLHPLYIWGFMRKFGGENDNIHSKHQPCAKDSRHN